MWDKVSALAAVACFVGTIAAGIPIWITVWPWPQIKAKRGQTQTLVGPLPRVKLLAFMLSLSFALSVLAIYGAWHPFYDCIHFRPAKMETIYNRHFFNQEVELDNRFFDECTFENVTFLYHGTGAVGMRNINAPRFKGTVALKTDNDAAKVFSLLGSTLRNAPGVTDFTVNLGDDKGNIQQLFTK